MKNILIVFLETPPFLMYKMSASKFPADLKAELALQIAADRQRGCCCTKIASKSPVSMTTCWNWTQLDMSVHAQSCRQVHPRNSPLLNDLERLQVLNHAAAARKRYEIVSQQWTRKTVAEVTDGRVTQPSSGWISGFYRGERWRSLKAQPKTSSQLRPTFNDEVARFREEVHNFLTLHPIPSSKQLR